MWRCSAKASTLATITFQNYFRLYEKLSGMTGTALTEEAEFRDIYKLDVIEVPTNRPMIRVDHPDVVYKTEARQVPAPSSTTSWSATKRGSPCWWAPSPLKRARRSPSCSRRRGVKHEVLNAKYHEKEAEIVAQAGKRGAVTIATNMAGRGTDIMLGGNAEYMATRDALQGAA